MTEGHIDRGTDVLNKSKRGADIQREKWIQSEADRQRNIFKDRQRHREAEGEGKRNRLINLQIDRGRD